MRFFAFLLTALPAALLAAAHPVHAQEDARPPARPPQEHPAPAPTTLDHLFDRLAKADSELEADGIATLIERRLAQSGSDTADLLMDRASKVMNDKNYPQTVELLDRILALEPRWA